MSGRMVVLSSAQWRSRLVVWLSGVLATSDKCAVDEISGDERRVRRSRVSNWSKVTTEDIHKEANAWRFA